MAKDTGKKLIDMMYGQNPDQAAFGVYPQLKPKRTAQDPQAAKNVPVDLLRGAVSGVLGAPGDIESLIRLLPGLDENTILPTSEDIEKRLPFKSDTPVSRAATGVGQLGGGFYTGPGSPLRLAGALPGAVKRAGQDFAMAAAQSGPNVIKPKGGNFLTNHVEQSLVGIKPRVRTEGINGHTAEDVKSDTALKKWVEGNLTNYMKRDMGTPEDPLRKLAEQGITHNQNAVGRAARNLDNDTNLANEVRRFRSEAGFPEEGMGQSEMAKGWEALADQAIYPYRAGDIQQAMNVEPRIKETADIAKVELEKLDKDFEAWLRSRPDLDDKDIAALMKMRFDDKANLIGNTTAIPALEAAQNAELARSSNHGLIAKANPWISKLDPEEKVYSGAAYDLGFDHIIDVLREDLTTGRIRPEQLNKVSMEQAVRRTYEYDQELAAKMAQARAAQRADLPVYKEYPEGYRWIELNKPGAFASESEAMGHSVRGYEPPQGHPDWIEGSGDRGSLGYGHGGWEGIKSGKAKVYSLVDPKGNPHVTVEVGGNNHLDFNKWWDSQPKELRDEINARARRGEHNMSVFEAPEYLAARDALPPRITQIKGKQNLAPGDEYLPFVQDFVKSGQWSDVGDLQNTGLIRRGNVFTPTEKQGLIDLGQDVPEYLTQEDIARLRRARGDLPPEDGMAHGGRVHISEDPDVMQMELAGGGLVKGLIKAVKGTQEVLPAAEREANLAKMLEQSATKERLYHATPADFSQFKPGGNTPERSGPAIWMTPDKDFQPAAHNIRRIPDKPNYMYGSNSNMFTPGTNVMPVYSSVKNPLITNEKTWQQDFKEFGGSPWTLTPNEVQKIKSAGHDGIMYYDKDGKLQEVVAFEPQQVKSAIGNRGTYDVTDPDINKAGGGLVKGLVKAAQAAKEAPSIIIPGKIQNVREAVRSREGNYAAKRVERAADEVRNLEKMFTEEALKRAFTGDNAKAVVTMSPADFEKYAQALKGRTQADIGPKMAELAKQGEIDKYTVPTDEYIQHLMRVHGGFDQVPYLNLFKDEVGIPSMPEVRGHEGRHRSRALSEAGEPSTLVEISPRGDLREGLPRRSQEEYIEALREELERSGRMVLPEADGSYRRPAIELPEPYAEGGEVHMDVGGAAFGQYTAGKKYQAAKKRAENADVNLLPDPKTYAVVQGLLGTAPDEMGFSVLHPKYQEIKEVADPAFAVGTALQVMPAAKPGALALARKGERLAERVVPGIMERGGLPADILSGLSQGSASYAYRPHTPLKPDPEVGTRYKKQYVGGLAPRQDLNIEDLEKSSAKIFPWDATSRNQLITEVSDVPLTKPVLTEGGDEYMMDLQHIKDRIAGASNFEIAKRIKDRIDQAAVENQLLGGTGKVYGFPVRMGERAENFSTFPTDIAMDLLRQGGLNKKELKALTEDIRTMAFEGKQAPFRNAAPVGTPEFDIQLREGLEKSKNKKGEDLIGFTPGNLRKGLMDRLSKVEYQKRLGYNQPDLVGAVLSDELKGVPKGYVGNVAAELDPFTALRPSKSSSYSHDFSGQYVGSMPNMPVEFLMPNTFEGMYLEMKAKYPSATPEALRNMAIGAMEKRKESISEMIGPRSVDAVKTYQEGLMKGEFDPNDIKQVYDYMRRKKLQLKLAAGGAVEDLSPSDMLYLQSQPDIGKLSPQEQREYVTNIKPDELRQRMQGKYAGGGEITADDLILEERKL